MLISPSILTADFSNLKQELKSVSKADYLHLDIMDGHFVTNISFGPYISKIISEATSLPLDIHLMLSDPLGFIDRFVFNNTSFITIHAESNNFKQAIQKIKEHGIKVGVSIKPNTNIETIKDILGIIDLVLVMSVEPGYGGQKFIEGSLDKIHLLNQLRADNNYHYLIEVDGGINLDNAKQVSTSGADIVVVGSYLFNQKNRLKVINQFQTI